MMSCIPALHGSTFVLLVINCPATSRASKALCEMKCGVCHRSFEHRRTQRTTSIGTYGKRRNSLTECLETQTKTSPLIKGESAFL